MISQLLQWHIDTDTIETDISRIGAKGETGPCPWHVGLYRRGDSGDDLIGVSGVEPLFLERIWASG